MSDMLTAEGAAAVLAAAVGAAVALMAARRQGKAEADKTAIAQYQALLEEERRRRREDVTELRGLVQQHAEQLDQDQRLIDCLYEENADCNAIQQLHYSSHQSLHQWCVRAFLILKDMGKDIGEPPELPKKPKPRLSRDRAEFSVRQSRQSAALVKEGDSKIIPPLGGTP